MCLPERNCGRLASTTSFLVKHSSATDAEVTTVTKREPNRSEKTGPYFCESRWKVRCTGGFMRWRLPRIGIGDGPGGRLWRFSRDAFDRRKNLKARVTMIKMIENDE